MSYEDDQERERLERIIRENRRSLNNPYEQDKWVERDNIREAQRRLEELERQRY